MKIKKGDTVLVIAGKDKGARGKVIQAYPARDRVLVEGVNRIKKHTRVTIPPDCAPRWFCVTPVCFLIRLTPSTSTLSRVG